VVKDAPPDAGPAGIDIFATPPGKRLKSIALLSGGERALTSIALICAIMATNPSPFVVLDEVDAALDESNSRKYADILNTLADRTQFVVITHNRATIHQAHVLYGVTMGQDGVSQLLSVKLDDVAAE
jgi:chromosome segregation protein